MKKIFIIVILSTISFITFSQKTYFDKKIDVKQKPVKEELISISVDTLTRYYDSLIANSKSIATNLEFYRVTHISFVSEVKRIKYFSVMDNNIARYEVISDNELLFIHKRVYSNSFAEKFRTLIDSTFWNYQNPKTERQGAVFDGSSTKIEGIKNNNLKIIERSNHSNYDTLFRLPESFFRKY